MDASRILLLFGVAVLTGAGAGGLVLPALAVLVAIIAVAFFLIRPKPL